MFYALALIHTTTRREKGPARAYAASTTCRDCQTEGAYM